MSTANTMEKRKEKINKAVSCQRCGGRMIFEKFYDVNNVFFGWHCVICGEILDPVSLLHRLSQDADLRIPEKEEEIISLVQKYLNAKPKGERAQLGKGKGFLNLEDESSLN